VSDFLCRHVHRHYDLVFAMTLENFQAFVSFHHG
jgi:hypothetical protein